MLSVLRSLALLDRNFGQVFINLITEPQKADTPCVQQVKHYQKNNDDKQASKEILNVMLK